VYNNGMTKTINTHVTAVISAASSILALLHPGFELNSVVQAFAVTVPALIAGGIEALHFVKEHTLKADLIGANHVVQQLLAAQTAPATEPAATPAPTTPAA